MRWFLFSICFLGCVLNLPAQTVHFDTSHNFNRYDYALYSGVVAYRIGDYITTEHALAHGGRELQLPSALVNCKPGFAVYVLGWQHLILMVLFTCTGMVTRG
jgi:hypothetical protein